VRKCQVRSFQDQDQVKVRSDKLRSCESKISSARVRSVREKVKSGEVCSGQVKVRSSSCQVR